MCGFALAAMLVVALVAVGGVSGPAAAFAAQAAVAPPEADDTVRAEQDVTYIAPTIPREERVRLGNDWQAQGPGFATNGQVENIPGGNPVCGGVHSLATHPTDVDILYAGAVNGGIWKTTNATAISPTWVPLTDEEASLATGDIEFDPTDPSYETLVAGTGRFSNFGGAGTVPAGILRTTNGGNTWTLLGQAELAGQNIWAVAPRGSVILVGADNGLYRSTDLGATFENISGTGVLGTGVVHDLAADPSDDQRIYAAMSGFDGGVFLTEDAGATWTDVTDAAIDALVGGSTRNMEMSVSAAGSNAVFLGVVNNVGGSNERLVGVFRSDDQGASWTAMDLPTTVEGPTMVVFGIHPGGQGTTNFSIQADPDDDNIVYVGGDRQPTNPGPDGIEGTNDDTWPNSIGATDYSGRLFRGDASVAPTGGAPSPQWTPLTHSGTATNASPHADSRDMDFDADGHLLECSDGGIYVRTSPSDNTGQWQAVFLGDLQVAELHDIAYDTNFDVAVGGAQDIGTPYQTAPGNTDNWLDLRTADGGDVAVDTSVPGQSTFFYSIQRLAGFRRRVATGPNTFGPATVIGLNTTSGTPLVTGSGGNCQFVTPIALNVVDPTRLIIGAANSVYESADQGDNIVELSGPGPNRSAMVYGHGSNEDLIVIGSGARVYMRTDANDPLSLTGGDPLGGGSIVDIVVNPSNIAMMFAVDSQTVSYTWDSGDNWTDITGNLNTMSGGGIRTVEYVKGDYNDILVVGAQQGTFATLEPFTGCWFELGEELPNTVVYDLFYDPEDDLLVAGLLGRGCWTLGGVADLEAPFALTYPNGGESLVAGCEVEIEWTVGESYEDEGVNILFSNDGGTTWTPILTNTPNDGSDLVTLPCEETDEARIAIELAYGSFCDASNGDFELAFPTITVEADIDNSFAPPNPWVQDGLVIDSFEFKTDVDLYNVHFAADALQDPDVPCEFDHAKKIAADLVEFVPEVINHVAAGESLDVEVKFTVPIGQHAGEYEGLLHVLAEPECGCPSTLSEDFEVALEVERQVDMDVDDNAGSVSDNALHLSGAKGDEPSGTFIVVNPNSVETNVDLIDGPGNIRIQRVDVDVSDLVKIGDPAVVIPTDNITIGGGLLTIASGEASYFNYSVLIPDDVPINAYYTGTVTVTFEGCEDGPEVTDTFDVELHVLPTQGTLDIVETELAGDYCPPDDPWTAVGEVEFMFDIEANGDHRNIRISCGGLDHDTLDETLTDFSFYPEEIAFLAAGETRTVTVVVYVPIGQHSGTYEGEFVIVSESGGEDTVPVTLEVCPIYDLDIRDDYGHLGDDVMEINATARPNQSGGEWALRAFDIGLPDAVVNNFDQSDGPGNTPIDCIVYEFEKWSSLWENDDQGLNYQTNMHFTGEGSIVGELCDFVSGEYRRLLVALYVPKMQGMDNHPGTYKGRLDCWALAGPDTVGHDYFDIEVHLAQTVGPQEVISSEFGAEPGVGGARLYWGSFEELGLAGSVNLYREDPATGVYGRVNGAPMPQRSEYLDTEVEPGVLYSYKLGVGGGESEFVIGPVTVGGAPSVAMLRQNVPNPFRDGTRISFQLPANTDVSLKIYDVSGRLVRTLKDGQEYAGYHTVGWDRRDDSGREVASGIYFCRLVTPAYAEARKMILLK